MIKISSSIQLILYIICWWFFSFIASLLGKISLNKDSNAIILTLFQLFASLISCFISKRRWEIFSISIKDRKLLFIIALCHFLGNLFTNYSIIWVPVSFAHTIKVSSFSKNFHKSLFSNTSSLEF
jgi:hypothetical protein